MNGYLTRPGSMAVAAAAVLMLTPGLALGQRGTSSQAEAATPEAAEAVQPAPRPMQRGQMQRGQMQRATTGDMACGRQGTARNGQGMQGMQAGAQLSERERLERMREHMISGMRRMAVRMNAVQKRIQALDRGEPDSAPPVEMGQMGRGMQMEGMQRGNGMQMRGGGGMDCKRAQPSTGESAPPPSTGGADR